MEEGEVHESDDDADAEEEGEDNEGPESDDDTDTEEDPRSIA